MKRRSIRKSGRYLPEYVTSFRDRHGKERLRFRRKGYPSRYFSKLLGTEGFREEYRVFNDPLAAALDNEAIGSRAKAGSIADLLEKYCRTPDRLGPSTGTQTKIRSILERFAAGREDRLVKDVRFEHIDAIISNTKIKTIDDNGRLVGGIEAARKLRKELLRLFAFAKKLAMIDGNPVEDSDRVRVPAGQKTEGFHSWSEEEIAHYRHRWQLGTKQRLAMELLLWTDQRKVDAIHLGWQHIKEGKFVIHQSKTGKRLTLPIVPQLQLAIDATERSDSLCFVVTQWGKPYSVNGFGNWFRRQCDAAGLPQCTTHGLRKATLRRMAERLMPNQTMKSVSGHSKDEELAKYIEAANQELLADGALRGLAKWEMSNLERGLDTKKP